MLFLKQIKVSLALYFCLIIWTCLPIYFFGYLIKPLLLIFEIVTKNQKICEIINVILSIYFSLFALHMVGFENSFKKITCIPKINIKSFLSFQLFIRFFAFYLVNILFFLLLTIISVNPLKYLTTRFLITTAPFIMIAINFFTFHLFIKYGWFGFNAEYKE